jgi:hypothetical protein
MAALMAEVAELYKGSERSACGDACLILRPRAKTVTMAQAMRGGR